jgi:hypothetical protein
MKVVGSDWIISNEFISGSIHWCSHSLIALLRSMEIYQARTSLRRWWVIRSMHLKGISCSQPLLTLLCFLSTMRWVALLYHMLPVMMFCLILDQKQWRWPTMDWHLWYCEPKYIFPLLSFFVPQVFHHTNKLTNIISVKSLVFLWELLWICRFLWVV